MVTPDKKKTKIVAEEVRRMAMNFKRLRKEKGWTQHELAKHAGMDSHKYIGHIEQCVTPMGRRARTKWATIFGVDVSEFLKPIDVNELQHELALLKQEAAKYGVEKIRRLIKFMPVIFGEGDAKHAVHESSRKGKPEP